MEQSPLRVLLIEDSPLIRERLAESLATPGRVEIIGQADSEQAAIGLLAAAPAASLQKIWNSRCDSSACSGFSASPDTPSARICASDGLTYLRPCTTVRMAPTSWVEAASLLR